MKLLHYAHGEEELRVYHVEINKKVNQKKITVIILYFFVVRVKLLFRARKPEKSIFIISYSRIRIYYNIIIIINRG